MPTTRHIARRTPCLPPGTVAKRASKAVLLRRRMAGRDDAWEGLPFCAGYDGWDRESQLNYELGRQMSARARDAGADLRALDFWPHRLVLNGTAAIGGHEQSPAYGGRHQ